MPLRIQTILKSCSAAPMQRWENTSLCPLDKSPWDIQSAKNRNLTNKLKKKKKIRIQSLSRGTVINDLCYCSAFPPLRPSFQVYCKNWKKCFNVLMRYILASNDQQWNTVWFILLTSIIASPYQNVLKQFC